MLNWKVCYHREPCHYDEVRRRRRHKRKGWYGPCLIVCAILVLLLFMPPWAIALLVCTVLTGLGIIWILA